MQVLHPSFVHDAAEALENGHVVRFKVPGRQRAAFAELTVDIVLKNRTCCSSATSIAQRGLSSISYDSTQPLGKQLEDFAIQLQHAHRFG